MARRKSDDPAVVHDAVLAAATALLDEVGPGDLSLRAVARRAEVAVGTVQYYFADKDALLQAVLDRPYGDIHKITADAAAWVAGGASPAELLERFVRSGYEIALAHRIPVRLHQLMILERGSMGARRRAEEALALDAAARHAAWFGVSPLQARLAIKTLLFAIGRYVASTDEDLRRIVDAGPEVAMATVHDQIVAHLTQTIAAALGGR
jgi:AcrR family transcriptional regulator